MKRPLTDRLLHSLAVPSPAPAEVWDQTLRGFGVRVSVNGKVTFFVMRRQRGTGRGVRITVGTYPLLSLAEARERARTLLRDLEAGIDPREHEVERLRVEEVKRSNTFRAVAEEFIVRHASRKRTARAIELRIRRELIARWGDRPITNITRRDVITMVEEIVDRGTSAAAHQTLTYTKRLFGWAISRDIYGLGQSAPTDRLSARDLIGVKRPRQRVLTDSELALIWRATEGPPEVTYPEGPFVRLLLLLGPRRSELARATWGEFDLDNKGVWTLGGERMKSDNPHVVPLPRVAVEILHALPRFGSNIIFSASYGARPLNDFGTVKVRLDSRIAVLNGGSPIAAWTFHDCRRTFRTGLSTLDVAPHVAELCIAHKQRGIAAVYDVHRYERERRDAMERWAQHLLSIVEPPPANVVSLRSAKSK
jgi:integrase